VRPTRTHNRSVLGARASDARGSRMNLRELVGMFGPREENREGERVPTLPADC
jgi:hypothetical protein